MQTKDFYFAIDMAYENSYDPFEVVEGDTGNMLHITLKSNGDAYMLNNRYICAVFSSSSGFAMQDNDSGVTIGESTGEFTLQLLPTSYGPGWVYMDVQVYTTPSKAILITSQRIDFRCRRALISEEIIRENAAYPPLIAAAKDAIDAAAEARAAVAEIGEKLGDKNVQSDWTVTDQTSDAYIKNKPYLASQPEDVGAAPIVHATRHKTGGADAVAMKTTMVLTIAGWTNGVQDIALAVTENSIVWYEGATGADGERFADAEITVSHIDGGLRFTAEITPTENIALNIAAL